MRPRIGVTSWHRNDADRLERWEAIRDTYTGAIRTTDGLPMILPIADDDPEMIGDFLESVDGLLFTGGEDVAPAYYREPLDERCQEPDSERDLFEIHLARAAMARRVPILEATMPAAWRTASGRSMRFASCRVRGSMGSWGSPSPR